MKNIVLGLVFLLSIFTNAFANKFDGLTPNRDTTTVKIAAVEKTVPQEIALSEQIVKLLVLVDEIEKKQEIINRDNKINQATLKRILEEIIYLKK